MTHPDARTRVRQRIKRLLEDRGYTQGLFARALGHKDQWASNFFKGAFPLSLDQLDDAAKFLKATPGEIVRVYDEPWELTPTEMRVVRALRLLPPAVRDNLVTLADYLIGVTPEEIDWVTNVRALTPENREVVSRWMEMKLFEQAREPRGSNPSGAPETTAPPGSRALRTRGRQTR